MARLFLLVLVAVLAFAAADIPVKGGNFGIFCINWATTAQLKCGGTVAEVLRTTGLSLLDFTLLQDQNMGYVFPNTELQPNQKFCIAGYYH